MNNRYICKGKRKDSGEWVEGYLIQGNKTYIATTEAINYMVVSTSYMASIELVEVIPKTVGQCTGLKDKNGELIFEGDVVIDKYSCERFGFVGVVIYNNELTQFQIFNKHHPPYAVNLGSLRDSIRILGNSIDNPELLEVER